MSRIFDNIDLHLGEHLKKVLTDYDRMDAAVQVMAEAVEVGGTSFDAMYINVNGESGFFETSLAAYGQEGEPCPRCGRGIRRIAFGNRSSHFCPKCQVVRS